MEKKVMRLAPINRRIYAYIIDTILPFIVGIVMICAVIYAGTLSTSNMYGFYDDFFGYEMGPTFPIGSSITLLVCLFILFAYLIVQIIFYARSSSIGKYLMGLKVVSSKNGNPLGFGMMLFRELLAKPASKFMFLLGYIWVFVDDKHRGWHDKIVESYVVDARHDALEPQSKNTIKNDLDVNSIVQEIDLNNKQ